MTSNPRTSCRLRTIIFANRTQHTFKFTSPKYSNHSQIGHRPPSNHSMSTSPIPNQTLIFAYGTLKRNFPNHNLLIDLISNKDATFIGPHRTFNTFPLIIGPHGIPYLLNRPGSGLTVSGELYSVSKKGLMRLDELEGVGIGHYERLPVEVWNDGGVRVVAEAYFGGRSFGEEMWKKRSGMVVQEYTAGMAKGYVRKGDRRGAASRCILDDIRMFLEAEASVLLLE